MDMRDPECLGETGEGHGATVGPAVAWAVSLAPVPYPEAVRAMEQRAEAIAGGAARELIWLLEHPPLYTAGTSARSEELLNPDQLPVFRTGRGGRFTYHGPGQRVIYVMLDVKRRSGDVRAFVSALEGWIIAALADLGIAATTRPGRVGIWVPRAQAEGACDDKIAAIGLRLRRWVSLHGASLNVAPNLAHYGGIVPCGISGHGVTSLAALGSFATMEVVDNALRRHFELRFAPTTTTRDPVEDVAAAVAAKAGA
jgi:lipoyl(octanoyl) transferase